MLALLLATAARDGYHRDELYFLEASRHLALGYVDQPPLSVLGAWLSRALFGDSLLGLRLLPALAAATTIVLVGLVARQLGGGRFAQTLAALCAAGSGFLVVGHLAGPTAPDLLAWTVTSLLVIRILQGASERLWLAVGLAVGLGLEAKDTIVFLVVGLAVALVAAGERRHFTSRHLWAGAAIALLLAAPNLYWQATNGWPVLAMDASLRKEHSGLGEALRYPLIQVLLPNVLLAPVWIGGLWALMREARFRSARPFALAYALLFVVLLGLIPDRPYYLAPLYGVLLAAGAVLVEEVVAGRRGLFRRAVRRRPLIWRSRRAALGYAAAAGLAMLPLALPLLPPAGLAAVPLQKVNYNLGETIGWPQLVDAVGRVSARLSSSERTHAVVLAANYGEAGAIDRYGRGLPRVYSGHNSYWWWGAPPASTTTVIAVGFDAPYLRRFFGDVWEVGVFHNPWRVENDEEGASIWLCRSPRARWTALWPQMRHYD